MCCPLVDWFVRVDWEDQTGGQELADKGSETRL